MMANSLHPAFSSYLLTDFYKYEDQAKRILIIDDDLDFRLLLSEILVGQGYSITTAKNGIAGISALEMMEQVPLLILLDRHMPDSDGEEFLKLQKSNARIANIPVIMVSGDLILSGFKYESGVKACLTKPLDVLSFFEIIQKVMS